MVPFQDIMIFGVCSEDWARLMLANNKVFSFLENLPFQDIMIFGVCSKGWPRLMLPNNIA